MIQLLLRWFRSKLAKTVNEPVSVSSDLLPKRYSFAQHQIAASAFSPATCEIVKTLRREGYDAYVVGGAVRDLLLGFVPKDFDIATNATPEQVKACFKRAFIIGRRFRLVHVSLYRETIEVSTFRSSADTADAEGRLLSDNVYGSQLEDAGRRDFSANALYYDIEKQELIDYHAGVEAIQSRLLRLIGSPELRYREDPVRMLRAVRLATKLGLSVDEQTANALPVFSSLLVGIPKARLLDELEKIFNTGHSLETFLQLQTHGVLSYFWPSLDELLKHSVLKPFTHAVLSDTDLRVSQGKSISSPFILGALLWPLVLRRFKGTFEHQRIDDFFMVVDHFLEIECAESLAIPRRYTSIIKEIWQLQLRFYQRLGQRPYRLLTHPRFRAGLDFLVLRQYSNEVTPEFVEWWQGFYNGTEAIRESLQAQLTSSSAPKEKRRSRRKRPNKPTTSSEVKD